MTVSITQFLPPYTLIATALSFTIASVKSTPTLTVKVSQLQNHNSQICLRVYANEAGFPLGYCSEVHSQCTEAIENSIAIKIRNLRSGTYAVAVVDDLNRDRQLNRNFLGIPQEGFGVSNHPQISVATGLPKFQDASFLLQENQTIDIKMKYALDS